MKKIFIAAFALASVLLASFTEGGYKIGDKAMDFKLKNTVDDQMVSLSELKDNKGAIVVFTCNHCPFAVKYESRIMALDKKYRKKGFPVIAISPNDPAVVPDDSPENMKKQAKKKGYTFPYLFDETQEVAKTYGATKTPHVYLLVKENSDYIVKYIGAIDDNAEETKDVKEKYVESAIENILAGRPVNPETTKAFGCSIKWKKK